ncbi:MAG: hypothetical protein RR614_05025 [Eubacterium sp.]
MKKLKPWQWVLLVCMLIGAIVLISNILLFISDVIVRIIGILLIVGLVFLGYTLIKNRKK